MFFITSTRFLEGVDPQIGFRNNIFHIQNTFKSSVSNSHSVKFLYFPLGLMAFVLYLIMQRGKSSCLYLLACVFEDVAREETATPSCSLNSMLIVIYKENVLGFSRTYLHFFVCTYFSGFERTEVWWRVWTQPTCSVPHFSYRCCTIYTKTAFPTL